MYIHNWYSAYNNLFLSLFTIANEESTVSSIIHPETRTWTDTDISVESLLQNHGLLLLPIRGNGHCMLEAIALCLRTSAIHVATAETVSQALVKELQADIEFYSSFSRTISDDITQYLYHRDYDSNTADIILNVLANAFNVTIAVICVAPTGNSSIFNQPPRNTTGPRATRRIFMRKSGSGLATHYDTLFSPVDAALSESPTITLVSDVRTVIGGDPDSAGLRGPDNTGKSGPGSNVPSGPDDMSLSGPGSVDPNGPGSAGLSGPGSAGLSGPASAGLSGPDNAGKSGPGSNVPSGPDDMSLSGPGSTDPNGPGSTVLSGPDDTSLSGPGSVCLSGPGSSVLSGPGSGGTSASQHPKTVLLPKLRSALRQALPLPVPPSRRNRAPKKTMESEIVTDTPVKNRLIEDYRQRKEKKETTVKRKEQNKKAKVMKEVRKQLVKEFEKSPMKTRQKSKNIKAKTIRSQKSKPGRKSNRSNQNDNFCELCGENYSGSKEAWTRCSHCHAWSHEGYGDVDTHGNYMWYNCAELM